MTSHGQSQLYLYSPDNERVLVLFDWTRTDEDGYSQTDITNWQVFDEDGVAIEADWLTEDEIEMNW